MSETGTGAISGNGNWMDSKEWSLISIGMAFDIQLGKMLNQDAKTGKASFPYVGNRSVQWNRLILTL
jgi:hypothetical protein